MSNIKILIVEDENMVALDIMDRLTTLGYQVAGRLSTGEEVLEKINSLLPDLILMDIQLKGNLSGIQTVKKLRKICDIPVIYLTAFADPKTIARAKKTQPDGYLVKPFNDNALFSAIETAVYRNQIAEKLKQTKNEAENRQKYLEAVLHNTPNAIITADERQRIVEWNGGAERLFGYKKKEVIGKYIDDVITKPTMKDDAEKITRTVLDGDNITHRECIRYNKNREPVNVMVSASPIMKNRQLVGAVGVYTDITEIKMVEQELQQSKENVVSINEELKRALKRANLMAAKAEAANKTKSEFLANMSHEIRTPMNGIMGMTELTLETNLDTKQREYLEAVKKSSESLMAIINDILDFSKIEAGKMEFESVRFKLRDVYEDTIKILQSTIEEKGLKIKTHISEKLPEQVIGDPGRLRQVLLNLLSNSVKFTEKGGIIVKIEEEKLFPESVMVHFCITDTGIGVPEDQQKKIFNSFTQADGSLTREFGGTGLGLTISSSLVKMMNGKIWLESPVKEREIREGAKGSSFHFTAHFRLKRNIHDGDEKKNINKVNGDKKMGTNYDMMPFPEKSLKILLAEDNMINKKLAESILKKRGFRVTSVINGKEVLQKIEKEYYDLILMDVQMPEMDGIEATREIRKLEVTTGEHIPIIAMTAYAMEGDKEKCIEAGMDDYISKPINTSDLWQTINQVIKSQIIHPEKENGDGGAINISKAMETVEGDKELFQELIEDFLNLFPEQLSRIGEMIRKGDPERLQKKAHSFKGAVANFGAETAYKLAYELENLGKNDKLENAPEVFDRLKEEMVHVKDYYSDHKWEKYV